MRQSQLFYKTAKELPERTETVSHRYLLQAGFIEQLAAGIYNFLPLGYRVIKKIEAIIREEMDRIGGQEVFLAALQPKKLWMKTGRWETMDPPLFRVTDRHHKELALGPTHEEVMTQLVLPRVNSYKDLPFALYQIQTKFRNEMRASGGLLRVREFIMKDLYSFHTSPADLDRYYQKVSRAYARIFRRCGLKTIITQAGSGSIGGSECHEFQVPAESGEDRILVCRQCSFALNAEGDKSVGEKCPRCQGSWQRISSIELGHIFKLGTLYSEKMGALFADRAGRRHPLVMGCYGIGVGRLMAAIIEYQDYHDDRGIIWPASVSPFDLHLLYLSGGDQVRSRSEEIYRTLARHGFSVLFDDRETVSSGEKFMESDLLGIPIRLVVSAKTKASVEYKERKASKVTLYKPAELLRVLTSPSRAGVLGKP